MTEEETRMEDLEILAKEIGARISHSEGKIFLDLPACSWTSAEWNHMMEILNKIHFSVPVVVKLGVGFSVDFGA